MRVLSFISQQGNTNHQVSLELSGEGTFRLSEELSDSFGMEEFILRGTYQDQSDSLCLTVTSFYHYSKYLTDLNPNEQFRENSQDIRLSKINSKWLYPSVSGTGDIELL